MPAPSCINIKIDRFLLIFQIQVDIKFNTDIAISREKNWTDIPTRCRSRSLSKRLRIWIISRRRTRSWKISRKDKRIRINYWTIDWEATSAKRNWAYFIKGRFRNWKERIYSSETGRKNYSSRSLISTTDFSPIKKPELDSCKNWSKIWINQGPIPRVSLRIRGNFSDWRSKDSFKRWKVRWIF